jgi:hypothetical protein
VKIRRLKLKEDFLPENQYQISSLKLNNLLALIYCAPSIQSRALNELLYLGQWGLMIDTWIHELSPQVTCKGIMTHFVGMTIIY